MVEKRIRKRVGEEDDGMRLEHFLRRRMLLTKREISRAKFRELGICVNGERRKVHVILSAGDLVEVLLETGEETSSNLRASSGMLSVLYEDGDVIAVDKPSGLKVHPTGGRDEDTLANRLAAYLREKGEDSVIRIVGRLDKDTSGAVLAVKNRGAAVRLEKQRVKGEFFKSYLAVADGVPKAAEGRIDVPIGVDPERKNQMCVDQGGKRAVTDYKVLGTHGKYALVLLRLKTGRTHQIRVHMAWIGCPLLGDPIYGNGWALEMKRTALHAQKIHFFQPFTGEELWIEAPLPEDISRYVFAPVGSEAGGRACLPVLATNGQKEQSLQQLKTVEEPERKTL